MVDFKYKVTDIAKDFGISTKKVIETFAELTGETRKTGATFEENEVNALMEALTRETAVKDLGSIWHPAGTAARQAGDQKARSKAPGEKEPKPEAAKPQPKQPSSRKQGRAESGAGQARPECTAQGSTAQTGPAGKAQ
ncbi:MAG: hypothetical protein ACLUJU_06775 [Subdoligranulum sp.]